MLRKKPLKQVKAHHHIKPKYISLKADALMRGDSLRPIVKACRKQKTIATTRLLDMVHDVRQKEIRLAHQMNTISRHLIKQEIAEANREAIKMAEKRQETLEKLQDKKALFSIVQVAAA